MLTIRLSLLTITYSTAITTNIKIFITNANTGDHGDLFGP